MKCICTNKFSKHCKKAYKKSFPFFERFSLFVIKKSLKKNNSKIIEYFVNNLFIGFVIVTETDKSCSIAFFAVLSPFRNKGYGSKILSDLKNKYRNIFLLAKYVDENSSINDRKRIDFYHKNDFFEQKMGVKEFKTKFFIMTTGKNEISIPEYERHILLLANNWYLRCVINPKYFNIISE